MAFFVRRLLFMAATLLGCVLMLALLQYNLIYHPRPYDRTYDALALPGLTEVSYDTRDGRQTAFYIPPRSQNSAATPTFLWMLFGGNASLALDWAWLVQQAPYAEAAFLLVEYPGYGKCQGKASPAGILSSTEKALTTLSAMQKWGDQRPRLGVLGHSLGAATALQFAAKIQPEKVILLSPFTSMADMAARLLGRWTTPLLRHRFDNGARLSELSALKTPPEVHLFHGAHDETIPVEMGRALAERFSQLISYLELPHSNHNSVVEDAMADILAAMKP